MSDLASTWSAMLAAVAAWDHSVSAALRAHWPDWPTPFVSALIGLSHLGDRRTMAVLVGVACLWAGAWRGQWRLATLAAAWMSLQGLSVWCLKAMFERARPPGGAIDPLRVVVEGSSLPSGHASASMAGYGLIACLLWMAGPAHWRPHRRGLWAGALVLALGIGLTRVLLGVHFASDVLAGWCLGAAWLAAGVPWLQRCMRRPQVRREAPASGLLRREG